LVGIEALPINGKPLVPAEVVPQELGKLSWAFHVVSVRRFIIFRHVYLKVNHANICKPQRVSEEKNFFILGWKMG
jgi:hypothetical protein